MQGASRRRFALAGSPRGILLGVYVRLYVCPGTPVSSPCRTTRFSSLLIQVQFAAVRDGAFRRLCASMNLIIRSRGWFRGGHVRKSRVRLCLCPACLAQGWAQHAQRIAAVM